MNFNGFNQNNPGSDGRPPRKLFTFGASQNSSPGHSGFGNQNRPLGQNPGFGQTSPNLVSFGSNSNNSLSSQPPQKMNFNFTNRSDSGKVVFKANAGTTTFRPPALGNSVRPRPMPENSLGGMKFNLTWDPKAAPERPVFPGNGLGLSSSFDHILSNQRRRDNAFSNDNTNIRSMSCLTDMTPRPTIFNTIVPSSGLSTKLPSTLSDSPALQNNSASGSTTPNIFTKSLLSQPPEARKNIFNFSKPNAASENPKTDTTLVPALSTEKEATPVNTSVSKPFEAPKFSLPISISEPDSKKSLFGAGQSLSTAVLPSIPAFGKTDLKSTSNLFGSQTTNSQLTKPSGFNIPSTIEGSSLSGGMFGFNSAKTVPISESKLSKPATVTPSLPSLFNLSKFKSNTTYKPNDEDKNKIPSTTKSFTNPFLTKKSFSDNNSKSNYSAISSLSKRPFNNFDTSVQSKENSSEKSFNESVLSTSKKLVIGDKSSKLDNIPSTSMSFTSSFSAPSKPNSALNTNQSFKSASPELLNLLNNSLISQIKNSMTLNPFKSLDEIITLALKDKDKFILNFSESKEVPGGIKSQGKGSNFSILEKQVVNNKEINSKSAEPSNSNKYGKFNFSFESSPKSTTVSSNTSPLITSSPPKMKAFGSFTFSSQSDPKLTSSVLNNKSASTGTNNILNNNGFQPTTQFSFGTQTPLTGTANSEKAKEASLANAKPSDSSFKVPTTLKSNVPLFSFTPSQTTDTFGVTSNSLPFSPRSETSSASDKDTGTLLLSNNKMKTTPDVSRPDSFSSQSNLTFTSLQGNSNPGTSGSLSNNPFSPKPLFSFRSTDSPVLSPKPYSPDSSNSNLSLGTTKVAPVSFSLSNPENSIFKSPSQTNTINSTVEISSVNSKSFTPNPFTSSQPSLKFGLTSSGAPEANSIFKFGSSNNSVPSSQSNSISGVSQEPGLAPQPIFKFELPDNGESTPQPVFKFGLSDDNSVSQSSLKSTISETTTSITQPDLKTGASPNNKLIPQSSFTFGSTDSGISAPNLTFKPISPDAAKSTLPLSFKFGSAGKDSIDQTDPKADTPNITGSTPTDKLILGPGGSNAQLIPKFGSSDKTNIPQLGFNFGLSGTSSTVSNDNKSNPTDSKTQPVFKFGSSGKSSAPQLGFNFGLPGTSNVVSKDVVSSSTDTQPIFKSGSSVNSNAPQGGLQSFPASSSPTSKDEVNSVTSDITASSSQPVFKFGSPNAEPSIPQKRFTFGSSDSSKSIHNPMFKFGANGSNKPVFTFGSSTAGPSSTPSFKFSTNSDPKQDKTDPESNISKSAFKFGFSGSSLMTTTPISNVTESPGSAPISFFPKEQAPTIAPKLNLSFGLTNSTSDNTSFKFSIPNSTSSLNESSTNEPKSDSEPDPAEEGFSGARTNDALIVRGQGEEEETSLIQLTIKLLTYDITKKSYTDMGVGVLKVNQHDTTKKQRIVCRAEGSGRLLLNANLPAQSAEVIPKPRGVRLRINNLEGIPSMFIVRIRTDAEVEQFIDVLEGSNKKS